MMLPSPSADGGCFVSVKINRRLEKETGMGGVKALTTSSSGHP